MENYFGLGENYTTQQLETAYDNKVRNINTLNISDPEKQLLRDNAKRQYQKLKHPVGIITPLWNHNYYSQYMLDPLARLNRLEQMFEFPFERFDREKETLSRRFEQIQNESKGKRFYKKSSSSQEKLMEDGRVLVIETSHVYDGNQSTDTKSSYYKNKDGTTEPVDYNTAMHAIENQNKVEAKDIKQIK